MIKLPSIESYRINIALNGYFFCEIQRIDANKLTETLKRARVGFPEKDGFKLSVSGIPHKTSYRFEGDNLTQLIGELNQQIN